MPPNLPALKEAAAANTWLAIYPELALGLLALGLLALEILLPRNQHRLIPRVAFIGQVALLAWVLATDLRIGAAPELSFGGLLLHDGFGQGFRVFFLLTSALETWLGMM
ncbi:MAG: NADH-quinone oxidoreductase subunit N, partial [Opitutaceae bacterium]